MKRKAFWLLSLGALFALTGCSSTDYSYHQPYGGDYGDYWRYYGSESYHPYDRDYYWNWHHNDWDHRNW